MYHWGHHDCDLLFHTAFILLCSGIVSVIVCWDQLQPFAGSPVQYGPTALGLRGSMSAFFYLKRSEIRKYTDCGKDIVTITL